MQRQNRHCSICALLSKLSPSLIGECVCEFADKFLVMIDSEFVHEHYCASVCKCVYSFDYELAHESAFKSFEELPANEFASRFTCAFANSIVSAFVNQTSCSFC